MAIWPRAVIAVAAARVGIGLALYLSGQVHPSSRLPLPLSVYVLLAAVFGGLGLTLVAANRRDVRAMWLGGVFVLAGSPLATPLLSGRSVADFGWLTYVRPDALLPALLWRFASDFPSPLTGRPGRAARIAWQAASLNGLLLALVSLSYLAWPLEGTEVDWRLTLTPIAGSGSLYYPLVFGLSVAAFLMLLWRAPRARDDERRRILLFTGGLVGGSIPLVFQVILEAVPAYYAFVHRPGIEFFVGIAVFGALATVPFVTAYSVLFDHVVELRVALRAAMQYGLARYTIAGVTAVPFASLALLVVTHRHESMVMLLSGPRTIALAGTAIAGVAALRLRRTWLEGLDRRYFREQYDARQTLERLAAEALQVADAEALQAQIHGAIAAALHADLTLFVTDESRGEMVRPGGACDPISTRAILVNLAAADGEPMHVDPSDDHSPFRRLPIAEQRWLLAGRFRMLLALRSADGRTIGLLALTAKRSGLEYSADDRRLLSAVAASVSLALDNLRLRGTPEPSAAPAARECGRCSRITGPGAATCECGGALVATGAPYVLRGTYQLERRLGRGGMGVVYLARDLDLDRPVAVKTLPRLTSGAATRLRAEARAMAAVVHPNLAVVHAIETWRGIPFLIEEYLAGGTLADRLQRGCLPLADALELGITLADALASLHSAGIVHRDVKPGNIGFTKAGVVKLLDFGLARLIATAYAQPDDTTTGHVGVDDATTDPSERAVVGTPPYMAPEALSGRRPRPSFDLWSLAVVLYEAVTGRRPFQGRGASEVALAMSYPAAPPSEFVPACPPEVNQYFADSFRLEGGRPFADAPAVRSELIRLRALAR